MTRTRPRWPSEFVMAAMFVSRVSNMRSQVARRWACGVEPPNESDAASFVSVDVPHSSIIHVPSVVTRHVANPRQDTTRCWVA